MLNSHILVEAKTMGLKSHRLGFKSQGHRLLLLLTFLSLSFLILKMRSFFGPLRLMLYWKAASPSVGIVIIIFPSSAHQEVSVFSMDYWKVLAVWVARQGLRRQLWVSGEEQLWPDKSSSQQSGMRGFVFRQRLWADCEPKAKPMWLIELAQMSNFIWPIGCGPLVWKWVWTCRYCACIFICIVCTCVPMGAWTSLHVCT